MNLFGDANDLLNENKGYVKQSEFAQLATFFFCFNQKDANHRLQNVIILSMLESKAFIVCQNKELF